MAYADDISIMARSMAAVTEIYIDLENRASKVGLTINTGKSKVLKQTQTTILLQNVTIGEEYLERVK